MIFWMTIYRHYILNLMKKRCTVMMSENLALTGGVSKMALEAILAVEQAEQEAARKKADAAQKAKDN